MRFPEERDKKKVLSIKPLANSTLRLFGLQGGFRVVDQHVRGRRSNTGEGPIDLTWTK